jgi:thiol-disulfide isomerase/thioredoxin
VKRDPIILIVVAIVISLMLVFGIQKTRHGAPPNSGNMQGKAAPDFSLASLDGSTLKLSDFRGKAVLLNFWATWCEPCKIEMPWFVELQKKYGPQGLQILGVAMDDSSAKDIAKKQSAINTAVFPTCLLRFISTAMGKSWTACMG